MTLGVAAEDDNKSTNVNFTVSSSYTWSAPSDITFTTDAATDTKEGTVSVTKNVIPGDKKLRITVASSQANFNITSAEGAVRSYALKKGQTVLAAGNTVLDVVAGTNTGSQALTFNLLADANVKAGTYTGTCTFTAAIVDASLA